MKTTMFLMMLFCTTTAFATDYQCQSDCTRMGYNFQFCEKKCYVDDGMSIKPMESITPRLEQKCYKDCINSGYMSWDCRNNCTY